MSLGARAPAALVLALLAGATLATPALDALPGQLQRALKAWKSKDAAQTVAALELALAEARSAAPLEIRAAAVVREPHTGLGLYTPAPGDVVIGRDVRLYVEVANMTALPAEGGATVALDVQGSFVFKDGDEDVPLGTVALGTQRYFTRTHSGLTSFGVDVHLGEKSPAGEYRMTLEVTDAHSHKRATRALRFVLQ